MTYHAKIRAYFYYKLVLYNKFFQRYKFVLFEKKAYVY